MTSDTVVLARNFGMKFQRFNDMPIDGISQSEYFFAFDAMMYFGIVFALYTASWIFWLNSFSSLYLSDETIINFSFARVIATYKRRNSSESVSDWFCWFPRDHVCPRIYAEASLVSPLVWLRGPAASWSKQCYDPERGEFRSGCVYRQLARGSSSRQTARRPCST